jgi:pimeloyl-ACP methyl ester carboxylesterase
MNVHDYNEHRRSIQLDSGPVSVAEIGVGAPALFVHGVFLNGLLWRNVVERVSDVRRCIVVDLPGHGLTPATPHHDFSLVGLATWLRELCDALDLESVDLVANDTGGAVAQVFAAHFTDRVRTLTLTNCDCHDNVPPEAFRPTAALAGTGELASGLSGMTNDLALARGLLMEAGYEDPDAVPDDVVEAYVQPLAPDQATGREFERFVAAIGPDDLVEVEDRLRTLDLPALIVWGTGDRFFETTWAYWLRDLLRGTRKVVEIDGAKLWFPDEHADQLATELREFWEATG